MACLKKLRQKKSSVILKNISLIITLSLCFQKISEAQSVEQNELSKNNFYFNAGSTLDTRNYYPIGIALVNYERRIHSGANVTWYGRAGFGLGAEVAGTGGIAGLGALTMLTGNGNSHFEINAGAFVVQGNPNFDPWIWLPLFDVGYRYQKPGGGFILKVYAGNSIGIGIGHAFRIKNK